jgi:hypothetical protein
VAALLRAARERAHAHVKGQVVTVGQIQDVEVGAAAQFCVRALKAAAFLLAIDFPMIVQLIKIAVESPALFAKLVAKVSIARRVASQVILVR